MRAAFTRAARSWVVLYMLGTGLSGCITDEGVIGQLAELECSEQKACDTGERCDLQSGSCMPCEVGECEEQEPAKEPEEDPVVEPEEDASCDAGNSDDDESECEACQGPADCSDELPICVEGECRACEVDADCPDGAECEDGHCKLDDESENEDSAGSDDSENAGESAGED